MKRAGHWLFNFAAAVSLVLCVVTPALWVRSYWVSDTLTYVVERLSVSGPGDRPGGTVYRMNWGVYHVGGTIRAYLNRDGPLPGQYDYPSPSDRVLYKDWGLESRDLAKLQLLVRLQDTFI